MEQFRAGNMAGVLEEAEALLRKDPQSVPALALAGLAAMRLDKPERAVPHLRTHVKVAPADMAARLNLATALIQLDENEEALAIVEGAEDGPLARLEGYLFQPIIKAGIIWPMFVQIVTTWMALYRRLNRLSPTRPIRSSSISICRRCWPKLIGRCRAWWSCAMPLTRSRTTLIF